jgi:AcrR family transcriptional regulator
MENSVDTRAAGNWPHDTSMAAFRRVWVLEGGPLWQKVYELHSDRMQIKNANAALRNLEKIFNCTFRLANTKGFQAMSLRDLSRETGISMGGLYAYISSKSDLATAIEAVLRHSIDDVMSDLVRHELTPLQRLKAIVYGDIYMNDIMHPWYYFCYLEAKGLDREQREAAMQLELKFDAGLKQAFTDGIEAGVFHYQGDIDLLATFTTAMLQQWYLKRWKFQLSGTAIEKYADFVFERVLQSLEYCDTDEKVQGGVMRSLA